MNLTSHDRRTVLKATGATLAIGLVAGCIGNDDDDDTNGDDTTNGESNGDEFDGWFNGVDNYDGVEDFTGESEVVVKNGTGPGGTLYEPPAIRVDAGTTVIWEWTGAGGEHTVTEDNDLFDSGFIGGEGETFEYTFDEPGTYLYYCSPHWTLGQKGAVVVE